MGRARAVFASCVVAFVVSGFTFASAQGLVIRAMAGGGYTLVDFAGASGYPDSTLENWDQAHYSFSAQGLWQLTPKVRVGGEAGWEQLYYRYNRVPYGSYPYTWVYREANWATIFVGPVVQLFLTSKVYVLCGADGHFFNGNPALGISAAIGAEFRLSGRLALPVEFRIKPIFGSGTPTVLQLNLGLAFSPSR
jgi:hypothetical protein